MRLRSFMNPFSGPAPARLTLNFVVTWLLDAKQSGAEILKGPDPPPRSPTPRVNMRDLCGGTKLTENKRGLPCIERAS